ncbi:MAG: energy transducer TonB [Acidobacteriota bacterium]
MKGFAGINGSRIVCISTLMLILFSCAAAQNEGGAIQAIDEPADYGSVAGGGGRGAGGQLKGTAAKKTSTSAKKASGPGARPVVTKIVRPVVRPWNGAVIGDKYTFLNFEVVSAVKPYYLREAKANGARGLVQVEVLIDANGSVLSARARTGNKLLHPEAERAALQSKFNRPTVDGRPARAIGFLVYRFGPPTDDD